MLGKRLGQTIPGEILNPTRFAGYVFRITSGNDHEGHPMRQGILTDQTVKILMRKSRTGIHPHSSKDQRIRRTAMGCIVSDRIVSLCLTIVKHGNLPIQGIDSCNHIKIGVTNTTRPKQLGPKRATKIRKLFDLDKFDDVRKYVVRKKAKSGAAAGTGKGKAPKIQRLVTQERIRRKKTIRVRSHVRACFRK